MTTKFTFEIVTRTDDRRNVHFTGTRDEIAEWFRNYQYNDEDLGPVEVYSPTTGTYYSVSEILALAAVKPNAEEPVIPEFYQHLMPKYFVMDPDTDDLLPDGKALRNGMEVLIADEQYRREVSANMGENQEYEARIANRWCKVTNLSYDDKCSRFVGVYEDGTKFLRVYGKNTQSWYVKKNTLWDDETQKGQDLGTIMRFLEGMLSQHEYLVTQYDYPSQELTQFHHRFAVNILQILRRPDLTPRELTDGERYESVRNEIKRVFQNTAKLNNLEWPSDFDNLANQLTLEILMTLTP